MRLEQLENFLKDNPNDAFILFAIAKEYEKQQDEGQALVYYQKVLSADPNYVGVFYHLGKLHERASNWQTAFQTYRQGMEVAQKVGDQHAWNELAAAKLNLGDDEDFE